MADQPKKMTEEQMLLRILTNQAKMMLMLGLLGDRDMAMDMKKGAQETVSSVLAHTAARKAEYERG